MHTYPHPEYRLGTHPAHTTSIPIPRQAPISHKPTSPKANTLYSGDTNLAQTQYIQLSLSHTHTHAPLTQLWHTPYSRLPQTSHTQQPAVSTHTHSPAVPGPPLPSALPGKDPAGKEAASPRPSPPDISPSTHLPGPLPSAHPTPSAAPQTQRVICPGRGRQQGLTWADDNAWLPRLTTASRRPKQASARPRPSTSGASRAVPGSPLRPLRLWLRRAAMGAGGCACLTAPPSRDPRDGGGGAGGRIGLGRGRGKGNGAGAGGGAVMRTGSRTLCD